MKLGRRCGDVVGKLEGGSQGGYDEDTRYTAMKF